MYTPPQGLSYWTRPYVNDPSNCTPVVFQFILTGIRRNMKCEAVKKACLNWLRNQNAGLTQKAYW